MTVMDRSGDDDSAAEGHGIIRAEFDWSSRTPSEGVIEAVAIAADAEPTAIEPLYDSVDPDALNSLVRSNDTARQPGEVTVTFTLDRYEVRVSSGGVVIVRPIA